MAFSRYRPLSRPLPAEPCRARAQAQPRRCGPVLTCMTSPAPQPATFMAVLRVPPIALLQPCPRQNSVSPRPLATVSGTHSRGRDESQVRTHARKGARGVERKLVPLPAKRRTEHTAAPATGGRGALRQPSSYCFGVWPAGPTAPPIPAPQEKSHGPQGSATTPAWRGVWVWGSLGCRAVSDATFWVSGGV